jgi:hypothetical protein
MKVLFLVQKEQRVILDRLYDSIARHAGDCDTRWLSSDEQANLKRYFREQVDISRYDRIVFFLRFKKEMRQWRFIRTLPNLVILEHDAYQNYIPNKYRGKYARHYHRMPWVRVLCSGAHVTQRLRHEGIDAIFIPKGYDQALIQAQQRERNIELGFVGSLKSGVYAQRKQFLEQLAALENMEVVRTNSGQEYVDKLNSIRFFASADIGMGEYMIKNFLRWLLAVCCWLGNRATAKKKRWACAIWKILCCTPRWKNAAKKLHNCARTLRWHNALLTPVKNWLNGSTALKRWDKKLCGQWPSHCANRKIIHAHCYNGCLAKEISRQGAAPTFLFCFWFVFFGFLFVIVFPRFLAPRILAGAIKRIAVGKARVKQFQQ